MVLLTGILLIAIAKSYRLVLYKGKDIHIMHKFFTFAQIALASFFCILLSQSAFAQEPEIAAPSAVVIDADTGTVIYEKNKDERNFPASITKVMTALLSIEQSENDYDQRISFSHDSIFSLESGSSNIAMNEGETLTLHDALFGLMLASANEVANALAEHFADNKADFAQKMTKRAQELGATNTNFTNAHGLPEDTHYTTAYDMSLIMREAVKQPFFLELISSKQYEIPPTEKQVLARVLNNSNKLIQPHTEFYNENVIGSKTGYTDEARHTLVTYAEKDGKKVIVVTMHEEKSNPYIDTSKLIDYAFTQYGNVVLFDRDINKKTLAVMQEFNDGLINIGKAELRADDSVIKFLPLNAVNDIRYESKLPHYAVPPIVSGTTLGQINIYCKNDLLETVSLKSTADFEKLTITQMKDQDLVAPNVSSDKLKYLIPFFALGVVATLVCSVYLVRRARGV